MGIFSKKNTIEFSAQQSYDSVDGGTQRNKILTNIQREARAAAIWLSKQIKQYSEDNFKRQKTSFFHRLITKRPAYKTPLEFQLFELPPDDDMQRTDERRLEIIRRIFEQVEKILLVLYNGGAGENVANEILVRLGNLTNPHHSMTKLKLVMSIKPDAVVWNVTDQDLPKLEYTADNLDPKRWPTLRDTSKIPKDQITDKTRTKFIMLTIISELFDVMDELSLIAGANIN
ncbi:uncharacterized protein [Clytia hemisphaerica]|uniref:Uncharacterized protein n=1 Tax=Clytia hemisphaerica TaxID=252671 RepID=A0A7M5UJK7_9CNID|eukprot:TCONS_00051422-protein